MAEKIQAAFHSNRRVIKLHSAASCAGGSDAPHPAAHMTVLFTCLWLTWGPCSRIPLADLPVSEGTSLHRNSHCSGALKMKIADLKSSYIPAYHLIPS